MATVSVPASAPVSRSRAVLVALFSTRTAPLPADCALVAARVALAWIFIYHGSRRLFGWFDGPGLDASANFFADTAHLHPGMLFAVLGGVIEFGGGIAIALGLFSRLAGAAIFGDMMMAIITVTWSNGINATGTKSGYELNLALGVLALMIAFFGAGRFSIDALIERRLQAAAPSG
jgi:putative oxidoreductase